MQSTRDSQEVKHILTPILEELISNTVLSSIGPGSDPVSYKTVSKKGKMVNTGEQKTMGILQENASKSSLLYKNFAFRNAESLQRALDEEERKFLQSHLAQSTRQREEYCATEADFPRSIEMKSTSLSTSEFNLTEMKTQTESTDTSVKSLDQTRLKYLMGLPFGEEEEMFQEKESVAEEIFMDQELDVGQSEAMKQARRYLRTHKIFEFFQFIIAHLLSALPDNPIEFILDLLDKCIVFRAGMGPPPLLYEKKHIEALFYLMDRMRTGYIEKEQYHTGMKTLGICSYKQNPPTTADELVHKNFFVEEAYENLVNLLHDLIRRRWMYVSSPPRQMKTPPPTPQRTVSSGASEAYKQ